MVIQKIKEYRSRIRRFTNYFFPSPKKFDTETLENREKFKSDYEILANSLVENIKFENVIDVGCAQGFLVEPIYDKGVEIHGIEVSEEVVQFIPPKLRSNIKIADFSEASGDYDLVSCVEVAEHIKPSRSKELVDKLCDLSRQYIFFTAAPPGQEGHGHINCRTHNYWISSFNSRNFNVHKDKTERIKKDLQKVETAKWLIDNCFLLQYEGK